MASKTCLVVIDGWGISADQDPKGDAIRNAKTPVMTSLAKDHAFTPVSAHGLAVGLPDGLMGNSEVGHLNIGAGRVVYQVYTTILRIGLSVEHRILSELIWLWKKIHLIHFQMSRHPLNGRRIKMGDCTCLV